MQSQYAIHLLLILNFTTFFCWKKQSHDILPPEIPHYDLTGIMTDIDSEAPLPGIQVILEKVTLFHSVDFDTASGVTDSSGAYVLKNITPGRYIFIAKRDGLIVYKQAIVQAYEPKIIDLELPKPLLCKRYYNAGIYKPWLGIHWKYLQKCVAAINWCENPNVDTSHSVARLEEGNFQQGFTVLGARRYNPENPRFHALTFLRNYWAASTKPPFKLYEINPGTSRLISAKSVAWQISDLTTDGETLWAFAVET
ncbi:carboxypeptidase regulatory-like domain-containing protein [candidate division KSB1 bacterium]|nr:carboxypeptidase regulatory-like domain-containing protein [candidate division KSB1 bacterium]